MTNFGCIFDGVTSGGKINLYAAQAFTDVMLHTLRSERVKIRTDTIERVANDLFQAVTSKANNPKQPDHNAEGGAATGAFVVVEHAPVKGAHIST